jgi:purine-binding chemotaxis protein CheW
MRTATSSQTPSKAAVTRGEVEFVTFYVGDLLIGADILQVEEINRLVEVTPVPHAPEYVRGVINLRGEVVTVVDLRTILGLGSGVIDQHTRTVVVNSRGEQVGLLVDRIADVVRASHDEINPPPADVSGVDGQYFRGVYKLDGELLVILDVDTLLCAQSTNQ